MAARAGANYVSLFWGRIRDMGHDASAIVRQVHTTFREWDSPSEIIVGSIRQMIDVVMFGGLRAIDMIQNMCFLTWKVGALLVLCGGGSVLIVREN